MRAVTVMLAGLCVAVGISALWAEDGVLGGFSFHKFRGPVSGEIQEVVVPSFSHQQGRYQSLDYVAKPDYLYSYGVQDPETGNAQAHQESRDGDALHGEYRVLQPDGKVRIVRYTADGVNGFQAAVTYEDA